MLVLGPELLQCGSSQDDLAAWADEEDGAEGSALPRQALPFVLSNGRAQPAIAMEPGGSERLREALELRQRTRSPSGSPSAGSSRAPSPGGGGRGAGAGAAAQRAAAAATAATAQWRQHQLRQRTQQLVFVGNDWPTALLPLWLQAYREVAASALYWGAMVKVRRG